MIPEVAHALGVVMRRWFWIGAGAIVCALGGFVLWHWTARFTATAALEQRQRAGTMQRELEQRLGELDRDLERVSQGLLQLTSAGLPVDQDPNELIKPKLALEAKAHELGLELAELDGRMERLQLEVQKLAPPLVAARENLARARTRFTEEHPKVKELRAALAAVEADIQGQGSPKESDVAMWDNPAAASLLREWVDLRQHRIARGQQLAALNCRASTLGRAVSTLPAKHVEWVRMKSQYQALKDERFRLASRQQALASPDRMAQPAVAGGSSHPLRAALGWAGLGGVAGGGLTALLLFGVEMGSRRIRGAEDLACATGLPVLGALGDLDRMNGDEQLLWGLHALTAIRSRAGLAPDQTLVCGVASLWAGEGRSTVIRLLAEAGRRLGYKVLTLGAESRSAAVPAVSWPVVSTCAGVDSSGTEPGSAGEEGCAPRETAQRSADSVGLALRQTIEDQDGRSASKAALEHWAGMERAVVLIELPPVTHPEAFILADHLPNLLWVGRNDMADKLETHSHCEVLRGLRANWVGAVLNRAASGRRSWRRRLKAGLGLMAAGLLTGTLQAQPTNEGPVPVPEYAGEAGRLSISQPDQLADWQKRLTLGPGDTFNVQLYEQPDTLRSGLFIGPDGRINYLEAQDVVAVGLTVDELRGKLEEILAKYRLSSRVVINPVTYASKKYYLLGNVNQKGVYSLDRPVTIIEAIARAGGFVTTQQFRNALTQADLGRSFLVRRARQGSFERVAVDFEGLFQRGELNQNLPLAPEDYLFFPPIDLQEVYVLGEVSGPGTLPYSKDLTVLGAIVGRGGFTSRAYKGRVLVVRGSLNRPQTFVINTADIVAARGPDFPLSNRDIVYVHRRPFVKAEELLEMAVLTFARAFVTEWAGAHVGPFITEPLVR